MITRENYEEYFLLYVDNELPAAARAAVEKFVTDNPDLREEWETLLQCRVQPDRQEIFHDKEMLLQQDLLSYIDGELDETGRKAVEDFVLRHPARAVELEQLSMAVSKPDLSIRFPGKESLYRSERRRVLFLPWMQAGIAAATIGIVALLLLIARRPGTTLPAPAVAIKKNTPAAVTSPTPAALHSQGSADQNGGNALAKSDPPGGKARGDAAMPAAVQKETALAVRTQELEKAAAAGRAMASARTTTAEGRMTAERMTAAARRTAAARTAMPERDMTSGRLTTPKREMTSARSAATERMAATARSAAPERMTAAERAMASTRTTTAERMATATETRPAETAALAAIHPETAATSPISMATTPDAVHIPKEQSSFATQALLQEAQADATRDLAAAAPAGRNKLRSFFRRVSRTLGNTADNDGDGEKKVLISAFQVALK